MEKHEFEEFLREKARKQWDDHKSEYHLARVSPDLAEKDIDYKSIIGADEKLSHFARTVDGIVVIQDKNFPARIGIRPSDVEEADKQKSQIESISKVAGSKAKGASRFSEQSTLRFLKALSALSDDDLEQVNIPVHILVKLISNR